MFGVGVGCGVLVVAACACLMSVLGVCVCVCVCGGWCVLAAVVVLVGVRRAGSVYTAEPVSMSRALDHMVLRLSFGGRPCHACCFGRAVYIGYVGLQAQP